MILYLFFLSEEAVVLSSFLDRIYISRSRGCRSRDRAISALPSNNIGICHTNMHTYLHAQIQTYMHTYIYTQSWILSYTHTYEYIQYCLHSSTDLPFWFSFKISPVTHSYSLQIDERNEVVFLCFPSSFILYS